MTHGFFFTSRSKLNPHGDLACLPKNTHTHTCFLTCGVIQVIRMQRVVLVVVLLLLVPETKFLNRVKNFGQFLFKFVFIFIDSIVCLNRVCSCLQLLLVATLPLSQSQSMSSQQSG